MLFNRCTLHKNVFIFLCWQHSLNFLLLSLNWGERAIEAARENCYVQQYVHRTAKICSKRFNAPNCNLEDMHLSKKIFCRKYWWGSKFLALRLTNSKIKQCFPGERPWTAKWRCFATGQRSHTYANTVAAMVKNPSNSYLGSLSTPLPYSPDLASSDLHLLQ